MDMFEFLANFDYPYYITGLPSCHPTDCGNNAGTLACQTSHSTGQRGCLPVRLRAVYPERRFSPQTKADRFPSPNLGIGRLSFYVGFAPIKNLGYGMGAVLGIGGIKSASVHGTGL
jgi:hypothetical protein